ncbi:hypothetical protein KJS93_18810 [Flavihumibacter fluvii]|nr:hypothetical protein [Flavihumibacter fluvii]ULQ52146.1 hypothetical protein KJS93_18810 [Flavihumibacter fluvii]
MNGFRKVPANGQADMFNENFCAVNGGDLVDVHGKAAMDLHQAFEVGIFQQLLQGSIEIEDTLAGKHFGNVVIGTHKKDGLNFNSVLGVSFLEQDVVIFHKELFL